MPGAKKSKTESELKKHRDKISKIIRMDKAGLVKLAEKSNLRGYTHLRKCDLMAVLIEREHNPENFKPAEGKEKVHVSEMAYGKKRKKKGASKKTAKKSKKGSSTKKSKKESSTKKTTSPKKATDSVKKDEELHRYLQDLIDCS
jgi:hypothetical protein